MIRKPIVSITEAFNAINIPDSEIIYCISRCTGEIVDFTLAENNGLPFDIERDDFLIMPYANELIPTIEEAWPIFSEGKVMNINDTLDVDQAIEYYHLIDRITHWKLHTWLLNHNFEVQTYGHVQI